MAEIWSRLSVDGSEGIGWWTLLPNGIIYTIAQCEIQIKWAPLRFVPLSEFGKCSKRNTSEIHEMQTPSRREEIQWWAIDWEARFKGVGHTQREMIQQLIDSEKKWDQTNGWDPFGKRGQMNDSDLFGIQNSRNRVQKVLEEFLKCELWISGPHSKEFGVFSLKIDDSGQAQAKFAKCELRNKWTPLRSF